MQVSSFQHPHRNLPVPFFFVFFFFSISPSDSSSSSIASRVSCKTIRKVAFLYLLLSSAAAAAEKGIIIIIIIRGRRWVETVEIDLNGRGERDGVEVSSPPSSSRGAPHAFDAQQRRTTRKAEELSSNYAVVVPSCPRRDKARYQFQRYFHRCIDTRIVASRERPFLLLHSVLLLCWIFPAGSTRVASYSFVNCVDDGILSDGSGGGGGVVAADGNVSLSQASWGFIQTRLHTPHLFVSFLRHARECAFSKEEIDSRRSMNELNRVRARPRVIFESLFFYFLLHTLIAVNGARGGGLFSSLLTRRRRRRRRRRLSDSNRRQWFVV